MSVCKVHRKFNGINNQYNAEEGKMTKKEVKRCFELIAHVKVYLDLDIHCEC